MTLPYRTVLQLPPQTKLVELAEQEIQSWIEDRRKVDPSLRSGFLDGTFFKPGRHVLGRGRSLSVSRLDRGSSQLALFRFIEENLNGTWQVDLTVLDSSDSSPRPDTLIIEAMRTDAPEAEGQVDPPAIVSRLLERETILDGRTRVTSRPEMVGADAVGEVFDAITDAKRSVTVIVASSLEPQLDERIRDLVGQLTSKVVGVAAVFVLSAEATGDLNRQLPESHQLERGRIRTYLPRVDLSDWTDGRRHRVLGPVTFARAIRGRRIAPYLTSAFATQTRSALLATPPARLIRRQSAALEADLARILREEEIEQSVESSRVEARKSAQVSPETSIFDRIREAVSRWLGRAVEQIDQSHLEALDDQFSRYRVTIEATARDLTAAQNHLSAIEDELAQGAGELEYRGLALAEAERAADKLADQVRYLQQQLAETGSSDAFTIPEDLWEPPSDFGELALRITPDISDHVVAKRIVFTGDLDRVAETEQRDQHGLYVQRCWEFVRALNDYAERKTDGRFVGNVHSYLGSSEHDGYRVTPTRHAPNETAQTLEQWGNERVFAVPTDVDPSGKVMMSAHFKAGQDNSFAPRLHYFDDVANSGRIYIGYIGRHLTNTKTKNS